MTPPARTRPALLSLLVPLVALAACTPREQRFESVCQLIRADAVEHDEAGVTTQMDVQLEWDSCPGDQFQTVRGGRAFAECMARYHVGDALMVRVRHYWDSRGFFTWDVYQVGDCPRPIEALSEGSFELSQECRDTSSYGRTNGFQCSRRPFQDLVSVCPWMARN